MIQLLHDLTNTLLHFFDVHQLPALFLLLLLEEAGIPIPIPGDTLILLAGTQAHTKLLRESILVVLVTCTSTILGASVLFAVMRQGGRPFLLKYGRFIRLSPRHVEKVEGWLMKRGRSAIVIGRLIPGLRIITTIVAGLSDMPYRDFLAATSIAAVIWSLAYYWIGVLFGRKAPLFISYVTGLIDYVPKWLLVLSVFFILFASVSGGIAWIARWKQRRTAKRAVLPHPAPSTMQTGPDADTTPDADPSFDPHSAPNAYNAHKTLSPLNPYDEYDVRITRPARDMHARSDSSDSAVSTSPSPDGSRRPS